MKLEDFIHLLNKTYHGSEDGETVVKLHLLGIKYAEEFKAFGNIKSILKSAEIPESYMTEIHKGMKLSAYVTVNSNSPI